MDWMNLAKTGQLVGSCGNGNELPGSIKFGEYLD